MKAHVQMRHWSGHGEGGTIVEIQIIEYGKPEDLYNSTPADIERANAVAKFVNEVLAPYGELGWS
jgi:hypothetical protein